MVTLNFVVNESVSSGSFSSLFVCFEHLCWLIYNHKYSSSYGFLVLELIVSDVDFCSSGIKLY